MAHLANGKLALLIDADNVPPKLIPAVMEREGTIGRFAVRRLYGNLITLSKMSWRHLIHDHAFSPVLVLPATGAKNATDIKLAIDAMDLVAERNLDGIETGEIKSANGAAIGVRRQDRPRPS